MGLSPTLPRPGAAIPFVGFCDVDTARAEVIYAYVSRDSLVSPSQGVRWDRIQSAGHPRRVLSFPLSYMDEPAATQLVGALLVRLGWIAGSAGDLDGDGYVTAVDLALLIDYAFFQGPLGNANNADVNGDCVVNLVDVVILIDHLFWEERHSCRDAGGCKKKIRWVARQPTGVYLILHVLVQSALLDLTSGHPLSFSSDVLFFQRNLRRQ